MKDRTDQDQRATLDRLLLDAHSRGDHVDLVRYYTQAADEREAVRDLDAACFYLTHAFVFALESGALEADVLNYRLFEHGRTERLEF